MRTFDRVANRHLVALGDDVRDDDPGVGHAATEHAKDRFDPLNATDLYAHPMVVVTPSNRSPSDTNVSIDALTLTNHCQGLGSRSRSPPLAPGPSAEDRTVRIVMSSSCSQPSPVKV